MEPEVRSEKKLLLESLQRHYLLYYRSLQTTCLVVTVVGFEKFKCQNIKFKLLFLKLGSEGTEI